MLLSLFAVMVCPVLVKTYVNLIVLLETVVEALNEVANSSENQAESMIATDLEDDQEETLKQNKCRWEDTHGLADFSADNVSEPELPFKSPHTLLNVSQSRRMTKKTAEAVSGESGSEDEVEVKMSKKAIQQESQKREGVVLKKLW